MPWAEQLSNGRYRACWRDAGGVKRRKNGFLTKKAAESHAFTSEQNARIGQPGYVGRALTWREWWDYSQTLRVVEASTVEAERGRVEKWVAPRWGTVPLPKITRADVQAWVNATLTPAMAPASVQKVYRILATSLSTAVEYEHLAGSPCFKIKLPVIPPANERFLTRAEFDTAAAQMVEPYRTMAILLVGTGMRFGEAAGLHWSRIDLDAGMLTVAETWSPAAGQIKAYPKGRRARRVPLPDFVAEALLLNQGDEQTTCGLEHQSGRCTSGLVIPAPHGGALNAKNVLQRHWLPALQDAGVPRARQHDLRHTYASWLIQGGASLEEVAEVLGHSSIVVTQRYAHLSGDYADKVRGIMQGA